MIQISRLSLLMFVFFTVPVTSAFDFKKIDEFKTLEFFNSITEFESSYAEYIQDCLDNTGGGAGGIACLITYELWDRELNIYYNKLMKVLGEKEKKLLKESQAAWITERDKSIIFNSCLLDIKYKDEIGTMSALLRAEDANSMIVPLVKHRVFILKKWFDFVKDMKNQ